MQLKFARTQSWFRATGLPAAGILLCFWTTIVSAQTNNYSFEFSANLALPDGETSGLVLSPGLSGMDGSIASLTVSLNISGGFNGDLYAYLAGPAGGFAVLLNRAGVTGGNSFGYDDTGFNVTFTTFATNNIHFYQDLTYDLNGNGQLTGAWQPDGRAIDPLSSPSLFDATSPADLLNSFNGTNPNGTWRLFLTDLSDGGESQLVDWRLEITTIPEPQPISLLALSGGLMAVWRHRHALLLWRRPSGLS